jgi:ATP-dependent Clp protease ATP-binding subunit ClpB
MLAKNGVRLQVTPSALALLSREGYDPEFGARPVKRVIQRQLLNALSKQLLSGTLDNTRPIVVDVKDDVLIFSN